jgi:hypothetical protein
MGVGRARLEPLFQTQKAYHTPISLSSVFGTFFQTFFLTASFLKWYNGHRIEYIDLIQTQAQAHPGI